MLYRTALCLGLSLAPAMLSASHLSASEPKATPAQSISTLPGFQIELLRSATSMEGSWISMTFDSQGRVLLADDRSGIHRLTLSPDRSADRFETLENTSHLKHCRGILFAHDSLYVCETDGQGIHRFQDLDGDDQYETQELIVPLVYQSRYGHGANQLRLGPDGKIYVAIGNDVFFPETRNPNSPYLETRNDWMLPNPHDGEQDPRSGFILRMEPDGSNQTIVNGGLRNHVDVDLNSDGEMFTWDADMEWDVGLPWYRPTRFNHVVSGGEYGWRWGTGKWPNWFPDSLPSNHDTNLGSPTGIVFGTKSNWEGRFREALYAADWQHGRILIVEFHEQGASYAGQSTVLAEGSPLNVSDLEFGPDGSLYFITGGRGSQSGLYRLSSAMPPESQEALEKLLPDAPKPTPGASEARQLRKRLEQWHSRVDRASIDALWDHLGSGDPWIRFAARVALENQPFDFWKDRLRQETDGAIQRTAWMALAHQSDPKTQPILLQGLLSQPPKLLDREAQLWWLRTLQLSLIRQGKDFLDSSGNAMRQDLLTAIVSIDAESHFPTHWLVGELLVALEHPSASDYLAKQLATSITQEEQIQHAKSLTKIRSNWSNDAKETMLQWLIDHRKLRGGRLVEATLTNLRDDFLAILTEEDRRRSADALAKLMSPASEPSPAESVTPRALVKKWSLDEIDAEVSAKIESPRDLEAGRRIASEASCLRCHVFGDRGSHIGPDLTNVGKRFDQRALLESIVEPSKQIDAKFAISNYRLHDGRVVTGRAASVSGSQLVIETDALTGESIPIHRSEIEESQLSQLSPMPSGLLDSFSAEEIADLLAYLRRGGGF